MLKNIDTIREQFPILQQKVRNNNLVYLDNSATTQKPNKVINALNDYYSCYNANAGRGFYSLAEKTNSLIANTRKKICDFINAKNVNEIIFTTGTTNAINLLAHSFGKKFISAGDRILISTMEHHANIVPWQILCKITGAILDVIPINETGEIILDEYVKLLTPQTKLLAITHVSNVLGTINPIMEMTKIAHANNTLVLVDGAQSIPHIKIDVQQLDCDFFVFSGHKMYAPTGCGCLYAKQHILTTLPPYQTGGGMIRTVNFSHSTYADIPERFEAGTIDAGGIFALGEAIDFINEIGLDNIAQHEHDLLDYATQRLLELPNLRIIGTAKNKTSLVSFVFSDIHPHDIATILDTEGIAVRAGHHCAMPLIDFYNIPATTRISFAMYNTKNEIDLLICSLEKICEMFA